MTLSGTSDCFPDHEKALAAAMFEIADFLPNYPDRGRTVRACAERVLAALSPDEPVQEGRWDQGWPAKPVQEGRTLKVTEAIRTGGLSLRKQEGEPVPATDPVRAAAERLSKALHRLNGYRTDAPECVVVEAEHAEAALCAALAAEQEPVALKTAREALEYVLEHHADGHECLCEAARAVAAAGVSLTEDVAALAAEQEPVERKDVLKAAERRYRAQIGGGGLMPSEYNALAAGVDAALGLSEARTEDQKP